MKFDYSRFNPTNLNTQKLKKFMLTKPRLPRIRLSRRQDRKSTRLNSSHAT